MNADTLQSTTAAGNRPLLGKSTDIRVVGAKLYLLPVETRVPLKFGPETLTSVTCARVHLSVESRRGETAEGWGETPLNVQWVWPSSLSYAVRNKALEHFCRQLARHWAAFTETGHPLEVGDAFRRTELPKLLERFNERLPYDEPLPLLAGLVCCSPFDIALHDAFGKLVDKPIYQTYNATYMNRDLASFFDIPAAADATAVDEAAVDAAAVNFAGRYPEEFLRSLPKSRLPVWHLVGGLDPLEATQANGNGPADGHPFVLTDWIARDGLDCLKVKLRGNDAQWDYSRLVQVGQIAAQQNVRHLTADFNCTVTEPAYVNTILDKLRDREPAIFETILYVEQPFPYDLEANRIDVRSVAQRKPLLMDESAHDWTLVRLGRALGWNGVALKTCKTQTGAILTHCWAKAHGLHIMVQDLTNPMLAQIPHVLLAAHADTMHGVESNAMQFYPEASTAEAAVHPGLYQRRDGVLDLSTIDGPGFGYRVDEIARELPEPVCVARRA